MVRFRDIRPLYRGQGMRVALRLWQRWYVGSPFEYVERFVPGDGRILDLGCGFGLLANLMALRCDRRFVAGVDVDKAKIAIAQQTVANRRNIEFLCADLADYSIAPCGGVVLYDVLHHLSDDLTERILQAVRGCIGGCGRLIIKETDTEPSWKLRLAHLVERAATRGHITVGGPVHFRSRPQWRRTLKAHGFAIEHDEHIRTRYGFFVPHSLFVCR
ncbi:MAG: class I SAM-dependent methyltransferase [Kiritimatiellae bacterium]|nr:class I SAM-dependent methyltransferase [Kiritimatiellia bacterium]